MSSLITLPFELLSSSFLRPTTQLHHLPCHRISAVIPNLRSSFLSRHFAVTATSQSTTNGKANGVYTVGDFMTTKEELHVVNSNTTVDKALQMLVENRITGFPVINDDWKLIGLVSDYDLLALDSISDVPYVLPSDSDIVDNIRRNVTLSPSGTGTSETDIFPEVDCTWKTFNEVQKLLSKTVGQVVGDVMTPAPIVVRVSTNLEEAARVLLETKYRRLPVVDGDGKLVGIITRGNVVRAALQIKRANEIV